MERCHECSELLLDYLYGLLEEEESRNLREHLTACAACQAALTEVQGQLLLLARAAQVYAQLPEFKAPAAETVCQAAGETVRDAPAARPEPASVPLPRRPGRLARRLAWAGAAAALLLLGVGLYGYVAYERGLAERQDQLRRTRGEVEAVEARFALVEAAYLRQKKLLPDQLRGKFLHLQVAGPASYQRSASSPYQVMTQGVDGKPAAAQVTLRLVDIDAALKQRVLFEKTYESAGEVAAALPAGLEVRPGSLPRLEVEATAGETRERVEALLTAVEPAYATHVAMNKAAYRVGDILFFRTLTLDRFSLQPPAAEVQLDYRLVNAKGQAVRHVQGRTLNGVGGGEIALSDDLPDGEYTLRVQEATAASMAVPRVLPESRRVVVLRDEPPQLAFDRPKYAPGDTVYSLFRTRRLQDGRAAPSQPVTVQARVNGKTIPLGGAPAGLPLQLCTNEQGQAMWQMQLPKLLDPKSDVQVEVEIHDGQKNEKVTETVPVVVPKPGGDSGVRVEFFPEGGELVAGLPGRVYFQAADALGQPVEIRGAVVDRQGREAARVKTAGQRPDGRPLGMGAFPLTPQPGETYSLRVEMPGGKQQVVVLPTVRFGGVVLSAAEGVSREGEPLRLKVHDAQGGRRLLLTASCRGRLVDQRAVVAGREGAEVQLTPVAGTRGVVRVTAYEPRAGQLVPLAERLVYRAPQEHLKLAVGSTAPRNDAAYRPGENVDLYVRVTTERGEAARAWLLAGVVEEKWRRAPYQPEEACPPAFFYLSRDVRGPEELEDVDVLLADGPQAREVLDLYLGTHGWRRFVAGEEAVVAGLTDRDVRERAREGRAAVLLGESGQERMRARYTAALQGRQQELHEEALRQRQELAAEKGRRAEDARLAAAALAAFEDLPRQYLGQAVGAALIVLFAAGCLLLLAGGARALRGRGSPSLCLGAAFVCLALCLGGYALTGGLRTAPEDRREERLLAGLPRDPLPALPGVERRPADDKTAAKHDAQAGSVLLYAEAALKKQLDEELSGAPDTAAGTALKKANLLAAEAYTSSADLNRDGAGAKESRGGEMAVRFGYLQDQQRAGMGGFSSGQVFVPSPPGKTGGGVVGAGKGKTVEQKKGPDQKKGPPSAKGVGESVLVLREYAHQQPRGGFDFQETVFWHPNLEATDGTARLQFDLSSNLTTYRLLLYGHSPSGRVGAYYGKLETQR